MSVKYDFKDDVDVIDQPSIITISLNLMSIQHASGTETVLIPEDGEITLQIGNINTFVPIITADELIYTPPTETDHWESEVPGGNTNSGVRPDNTSEETSNEGTTSSQGEYTPIVSSSKSYATGGTAKTIGFNIINQTGQPLYYNGHFKLHIKKGNGSNAWGSDGKLVSSAQQVSWPLMPPSDLGEPYNGYYYSHHWKNYVIPVGESKLFTMSSFKYYDPGKTGPVEKSIPLSTYCDSNWYFVTTDNIGYQKSGGTGGIPAIWLGCAIYDGTAKKNNAFMYNVAPVRPEDSKLQTGKIYNLVVYKAHTESKYWSKIVK